jgi:hypothetical protein
LTELDARAIAGSVVTWPKTADIAAKKRGINKKENLVFIVNVLSPSSFRKERSKESGSSVLKSN